MKKKSRSLYKFTNKSHQDSFFGEGVLRLGTLNDFKDVEKHRSAIGDIKEGFHYISRNIDKEVKITANSKEPILSELFKIDGEGSLSFANMTVSAGRTSPNGFVFCSSILYRPEIFKRWHSENPEYDSCYEIFDPLSFYTTISEHVKNSIFMNARQRIFYTPEHIDYESTYAKTHPAFTKEEVEFGWQHEYRMVWQPKLPSPPLKPWFITIPEATKYCRHYMSISDL